MPPTIDRRRFIGSAAATAAFFAAREVSARQDPVPPEPPRPRLLALELLSGAPLATMKAFYGKTLDLTILKEATDRFIVEAGETQITFIESPSADPGRSPFYHFAISIPENKIREALEWQKARTPILTIPEPRRAPGHPPEVAEDRQANAHSIFFEDPAGNLVEYVARHDLKNGHGGRFGWSDLLHVSEIALIVDDVAGTAEKMAGPIGLRPRKGGTADVAAIGDEYGQIVLTKRGRPFDFASNPQRGAGVYRTGITLRAEEPGQYELAGYPYQVVLEKRCSCA
jgi:catechol 2,3-dioxygenase-like lactoylglutathione lyase family enzyme